MEKKRYIESLYFGKKDIVLKRLNNLLKEKNYDKSLVFKTAIEASLNNKESFCIARIFISDEDTKLPPVYVPISVSEYDKDIYEWISKNTDSKRGTILKQLIMNCIEIVDKPEDENLPNYHILISKGITIYQKKEKGLNKALVSSERYIQKQDKLESKEKETKPKKIDDKNVQEEAINTFLKKHTHRLDH